MRLVLEKVPLFGVNYRFLQSHHLVLVQVSHFVRA